MATSILEARGGCVIPQASQRGYHIMYREHETNHCPGCGRTHWLIGRTMAECAFCETALPLESSAMTGGSQIVRTIRRSPYRQPAHAFAA
jgi:hypothetical protein